MIIDQSAILAESMAVTYLRILTAAWNRWPHCAFGTTMYI